MPLIISQKIESRILLEDAPASFTIRASQSHHITSLRPHRAIHYSFMSCFITTFNTRVGWRALAR